MKTLNELRNFAFNNCIFIAVGSFVMSLTLMLVVVSCWNPHSYNVGSAGGGFAQFQLAAGVSSWFTWQWHFKKQWGYGWLTFAVYSLFVTLVQIVFWFVGF